MIRGRPWGVDHRSRPETRALWVAMRENNFTMREMADRSGVSFGTLIGWRQGRVPGLPLLQCCYEVLGLELRISYEVVPMTVRPLSPHSGRSRAVWHGICCLCRMDGRKLIAVAGALWHPRCRKAFLRKEKNHRLIIGPLKPLNEGSIITVPITATVKE